MLQPNKYLFVVICVMKIYVKMLSMMVSKAFHASQLQVESDNNVGLHTYLD